MVSSSIHGDLLTKQTKAFGILLKSFEVAIANVKTKMVLCIIISYGK